VNGFILACESGNLDLVHFLANLEGVDVNHHSTDQDRISPLVAASAFGRLEVIHFLEQDERFDTDSELEVRFEGSSSQRQYAFRMACRNGHKTVVGYFITNGQVDFTRTVCRRASLVCCTDFEMR
jgi:ankyrin repeat protein